jgi:hypothetical protein
MRTMACISVAMMAVVACSACSSRSASKIAWPAYAPSYGVEDPRLPAAGSAVGIVVVDNDMSLNAFDPTLDSWINSMIAKKQLVFGYVPVCDGSIAPTEPFPSSCPAQPTGPGIRFQSAASTSIQMRINNLLAYHKLSGVYLDQGPIDNGSTIWSDGGTTQQHYQEDAQAVRMTNSAWKVMVEAAGYDQSWIDGTADFMLLWEDNCKQLSSGFCSNFDTQHVPCVYSPPDNTQGNCVLQASAPRWWSNTKKVVNSLCKYNPGASGLPADMASLKDVFKNAWKRGVGYLGVTNNDCQGKLGAIPTYWDAEVNAAK